MDCEACQSNRYCREHDGRSMFDLVIETRDATVRTEAVLTAHVKADEVALHGIKTELGALKSQRDEERAQRVARRKAILRGCWAIALMVVTTLFGTVVRAYWATLP